MKPAFGVLMINLKSEILDITYTFRHFCFVKKLFLIFIILFLCSNTFAFIKIDIRNLNQSLNVKSTWTPYGTILFSGQTRQKTSADIGLDANYKYLSNVLLYGLHFKNGLTNELSDSLLGVQSLIVGVDTFNTIVKFQGYLTCDASGYVHVSLVNNGKLVLGSNAHIDIVNDAYYTRQLWIYGDGTGIFETEEGFVADRTHEGTIPDGAGSFRFRACTFISHHSRNLPMTGFPQCIDCPDGAKPYNGHLVFEDQGPSHWIIATNDQTYGSSIWIGSDLIIETQKKLVHTGKRRVMSGPGGNYTLNAGFQTTVNDVKITKRGIDTLLLSGEQAYKPGTVFQIEAGVVNFKCDAAGGWMTNETNKQGSQELKLHINNNGKAIINTPIFHVKTLKMESNAQLLIYLSDTINIDSNATISGNLKVIVPDTFQFDASNEYKIFDGKLNGTFKNIEFTKWTWDTSKLYSEGIIKPISTSVLRLASTYKNKRISNKTTLNFKRIPQRTFSKKNLIGESIE